MEVAGGRAAEDEDFDDAFVDELPVVRATRGGGAAAADAAAASGGEAPAALPSTDGAEAKPIQLQESEHDEKQPAFWAELWERLDDLGDRAGVSPRDDVQAFIEAVQLVPLSASERAVASYDLKVLRGWHSSRHSTMPGSLS